MSERPKPALRLILGGGCLVAIWFVLVSQITSDTNLTGAGNEFHLTATVSSTNTSYLKLSDISVVSGVGRAKGYFRAGSDSVVYWASLPAGADTVPPAVVRDRTQKVISWRDLQPGQKVTIRGAICVRNGVQTPAAHTIEVTA